MMTQAFYTGISGLQTFQTGIDTISNNLANISTVGFKGYDTEFASLFEKSMNTGVGLSNTIGVGARVQANSMTLGTGSMMTSDRSTDLAIMGEGWFGVSDGLDTLYTRAGNFNFDRESDLVATDGFYVLGTMGGNISGETLTGVLEEIPLGDIGAQQTLRFPKELTYPAEPTSVASFTGNIGLDDEMNSIGAGVIDPNGDRNRLRLSFTKVVPQPTLGSLWDAVAVVQSIDNDNIDGNEVTYDTQTGRVAFDERGALISNALASIDNNGSAVSIDLGTGFEGLVAMEFSPVSVSSQTNGIAAGNLAGYTVDRNSEVIASFSNGMQSSVGKVAVYHFANDQGLERQTGTRFSESSNSGKAHFYKDMNGQNVIGATVANYNLESSNVRMEVALTDLIIFQRSYDANSKSITTADEMMQKALSMDA